MYLLVLICLLTLADIVLTYYGLSLEVIREANPLMARLFDVSPIFSIILAICFVIGACLFFYKVRHRITWLPAALILILVIKLGVIGLHLRWLIQLALL